MEGHILHLPPQLRKFRMIGQFCSFANEESEDEFIHPVIKGILLHFWLYIHPFMDGNGERRGPFFTGTC
jgi:Fic family protein